MFLENLNQEELTNFEWGLPSPFSKTKYKKEKFGK